MGPEVLLLPLAPLYAAAVKLRAAAYRRGALTSTRATVPVISVGNLTFGGTGKTPMVAALVRDLVARGRRPAVLTRGYGRRGRAALTLLGPDAGVPAEIAGDEPLVLSAALPGVPVVVDSNRVRGAARAVAGGSDVVVLDDGFQHLALERDLDIVLVDAGDPWGGGRMPPRGRLREPLEALRRASAVVVTKLPVDGWEAVLAEIGARVEQLAPGLPVMGARLRPSGLSSPDGVEEPSVLNGRRVLAFAGLARPEGFLDTLEELGAELAGFLPFRDHHRYSDAEVARLIEEARRLDALPVTTAKDGVKLPAEAPVAVLDVRMEPLDGSWDRLWALAPEVVP